ncbi:MAG TPA: carboxypeptidase regulatory-like domain-containing protein [Coleofasciculaceae cyanobacterium]|jgi:hypothetical protein
MFYRFCRATRRFWLACLLLHLAVYSTGVASAQNNPASEQPAVLQGGVRKSLYQKGLQPVSLSTDVDGGMVESAGDHAPLSGVTVSIPNTKYKTTSGMDGRFTLPELPQKPVIVAFRKNGYVPVTVTLDRNSVRRHPLVVSLSELRNTLVLDEQIRHLGDGSFSPISAGAGKFRRDSEGPVFRRRFGMDRPINGSAVLEIGSVIGLDTHAAHALGQSRFHHVSTPVQVLLNGELIGEITINGDRQRMTLPEGLLKQNESNILEIRTGYRHKGGGQDYDDMELMLITITLQRV